MEAVARATITHWDLDGLGSAAILHFKLKPEVQILASVTSVVRYLKEVLRSYPSVKEVWVADLNPPPAAVPELVEVLEAYKRRGARIRWYDHHEWDPRVYRALVGYEGVLEYVVDPNYTSSDLLARRLGVPPSKLVAEIVKLSYDDDLFENKYELTVMWRRVLRWYGWDVRYRALESFKSGDIAPGWMIELYRREVSIVYENLIREAIARMDVVERGGFRIIVFPDVDPRVHPGELIKVSEDSGIRAHVYVVRYPRGASLRSDYVDVSRVAREFGGGGHRRSAGIPGPVDVERLLSRLFELLEPAAPRESRAIA